MVEYQYYRVREREMITGCLALLLLTAFGLGANWGHGLVSLWAGFIITAILRPMGCLGFIWFIAGWNQGHYVAFLIGSLLVIFDLI